MGEKNEQAANRLPSQQTRRSRSILFTAANLIFNRLHELLTDTNWVKWDLWTTSRNKSSCAFTSVRASGVVTGVIGSTSI